MTARLVPQLLRDVLAVTTTGSHSATTSASSSGKKDSTGSLYSTWVPPVGTVVGQLECVWSAAGVGGAAGGGGGADGAGGVGGSRRGSSDEERR